MEKLNQMCHKLQFIAWIVGLSIWGCGTSLAQTSPLASAPLETATVTLVKAGYFVVGSTYTIANVGTTNFTLIGASANTAGTVFTATGVGTGTGTAATTATVLPNLMFMLDDSGSMAWDYMPDPSLNFAGKYGFNSSQCNGMAYNPNITYTVPVTSTGATLNASAPTTFTAAYVDGFNTGSGTVDLNTQFTGGSGSGSSGESLTPGPAFYYVYGGTQVLPIQQNYFNTSGTFYTECNSNIGSSPTVTAANILPGNTYTIASAGTTSFTSIGASSNTVGTVFTATGPGSGTGTAAIWSKFVLSSYPPSATFTVTGGTSTLTVGTGSKATGANGITVNGKQIMSGATSTSSNNNTLAGYIQAKINACTAAISGSCTVAGYSATVVGNVVTIISPGTISSGFTPVVSMTNTGGQYLPVTVTAFPAAVATQVTNITANGTSLLAATATETTTVALATDISNGINAGGTGCTATVAGSVVSVTNCGNFASGAIPVISETAGGMPVTGTTFTRQSPLTVLNNFARWYSYYSHRMLMMKTVAGQVFSQIGNNYRVGFMTMNNNVSPDFVDPLPFNAAQKSAWFSKFYASVAGNSTPLREALSHVGQLYAHKFGSITKYNATITVKCSNGATTGTCPATDWTIVDSLTVPATGTVNDVVGGSLFDPNPVASCPTDPHAPLCSTAPNLAAAIANAINAMIVSDYGASVSGNVVTVSGPAPALGLVPVVHDSSPMVETSTAFTATTTTAQINNYTPLDPVQFSCQQNFVILDTDGYWNGSNSYDMNNAAVGNTDGTTAYTVATTAQTWGPEIRPMLDGTNTSSTLADVAEYYYQTDLRDPAWGNQTGALGVDVSVNNVPTPTPGVYTHQNMTTFSLGLGARGNMVYSSTYQTDTAGDYYSILNGLPASGSAACSSAAINAGSFTVGQSYTIAYVGTTDFTAIGAPANVAGTIFTATGAGAGTGTAVKTCICSWQTTAGSVCNWSVPNTSGGPNNIDDLWHAAVNGRGQYFAATDPATLSSGLNSALLGIHAQVGAASAAAVSSPVITQSSNSIFSSTYTTDWWDGNVTMNTIDPVTGQTSSAITWCSDGVNTGTVNIANAGGFVAGTTYTISTVGTTNFMAVGAANNSVGTVFTATASGSGTGSAIVTPLVTAGNFAVGTTYTIVSVGTTDFTTIGAPVNLTNTTFVATGAGTGSGTAIVTIQGYCPTPSMLDNRAQTDCPSNYSHKENLAGPSCATPDITVSRKIYTFDTSNGNNNFLKSFVYGSLTLTEQGYFNTKCSSNLLSQCANAILTPTQVSIADNGLNLVDYLRGNQWYETPVAIYRQRFRIEGDSVDAAPVYIQAPTFNFADTQVRYSGVALLQTYAAYHAAQTTRQAMLYVGANDGMLHAFNAVTGAEMWAYIPRIVMPNLYKLADTAYATQHQYYVDGNPSTMDIYVDGPTSAANNLTPLFGGWHTILVGALNGGGRGFYALDVTNPSSPQALWEVCSDSTLCAISDHDMGFSFGNPVITKRSSDGRWVVLVTSGYFNGTYNADGQTLSTTPGSGQGALFELDAVTGAVLNKVLTGSGSAAAPSGLAKISPWIDNPQTDMTTRFLWGGDLNGDIWRFDLGPQCLPAPCLSNPAITVTKIASLKDSTGGKQPVTTRVQLADPLFDVSNSLSATVGQSPPQMPAVLVATGEYLGLLDLGNYQVQSVYAIKDNLSVIGAAAYYGNPRTYQTGLPPQFVQQFIYQTGTGATATRTTSLNMVNWKTNSGWYADFQVDNSSNVPVVPPVTPGERVNIDPTFVNGTLVVVTNVPDSTACVAGGTSWVYGFNLWGQPVSSANGIVGTPLSLNSLTVGYTLVSLQGGTQLGKGHGGTGQGLDFAPPETAGATKRASWRELLQQ